eukprot:SAG25_NODE_1187_length_3663_cov_3.140853_5_plen_31_part_01
MRCRENEGGPTPRALAALSDLLLWQSPTLLD